MSVSHTARMDEKSWTIYGVLLGLVVPPALYGLFSLLDIGFIYKCLIWLGVVLFLALPLRWYAFIIFLRRVGGWAYGKRTQS